MALIRMKLLSVSSAIRMVLEGGVGSVPASSFFGEVPGAVFLIDYMKSDLEAIEILLEWCIKRWDVLKVWLAF